MPAAKKTLPDAARNRFVGQCIDISEEAQNCIRFVQDSRLAVAATMPTAAAIIEEALRNHFRLSWRSANE